MERQMGFEPTTLSLARRCSTTEPLPLEGYVLLYESICRLSIAVDPSGFIAIMGATLNIEELG